MRPIIIGAGPVGSYAGVLLKDLNPIIIEAKKKIGVPVRCTGLVSPRLKEIVNFPKELIQKEIKGAKFFSENYNVTIKGKAYVIDRAKFDQWINSISCKTILGETFLQYKNGIVKTSKKKYKTNLVIDCSGPKKESYNLMGVQAVAKLKRDDFVELHFTEVNDFFAWVVPEGEYCRIGLATDPKNQPMLRLKKFLKKIKAGKIKEWNAGLIPITPNKFIYDNYIRVGDAAGQVKAISGGGIVTGMLSAEIMASAVHKAYKENNFSEDFFKKYYELPWKKTIGKELKYHLFARLLLNQLNPNEIVKFIIKNKKIIESRGDMDFPMKLIISLIFKNMPFIIKNAYKIIKSLKAFFLF